MAQKIDVGIPIDLQALLDTRALIQAGSGGGKSYMLRKVVESVGDKVQQIILDPEGEFVTLREKYPFALVAKDGDIPLNLKYAETLAHKILETGISCIIDLYELKKHERILFVQRFLDALMNAPKELWHHCLVYVDEAHVFCPESTKSESAASVIDLATRGRKRGFAAVLATQRLSKLHKDAAAECLNKMIGRTGLDIDRKRAGDELGMTSKQEMLSLRELQVGEFYAFGPAISNEVTKFKTSKVVTTHLQAGKRVIKAPPTPGAIKKILSRLKDIPEEAEKELKTKQELAARIRTLQREILDLKKGGSGVPKTDSKLNLELEQEIQSLKVALKSKDKQLIDAGKQFAAMEKKYQQLQKTVTDVLQKAISSIESIKVPENKIEMPHIPMPAPEKLNANTAFKQQPQKAMQAPVRASHSPGNNDIKAGPHKMLKVLATLHPEAASKERLSMLSGYSITSSTFGIYIGKLVEPGYIIKSGEGYKITEAGLDAVGPYESLPTDSDTLINYWKGKLAQGPGKMFEILCSHWPEAITKEQLSEQSGYSLTSSTFGIYVGKLRTLKLITELNKLLKASDALFQDV